MRKSTTTVHSAANHTYSYTWIPDKLFAALSRKCEYWSSVIPTSKDENSLLTDFKLFVRFFSCSHTYRAYWYYQRFCYSPTDARLNCLKKTILKFTLKLTLKLLRHVSVQSHKHRGPTNICSHITTHRGILIGYFNNRNFSKHEECAAWWLHRNMSELF